MRGLKIFQAPYEAGFWDEHPNPTCGAFSLHGFFLLRTGT